MVFWDPESIIIARTGLTLASLFNYDFDKITWQFLPAAENMGTYLVNSAYITMFPFDLYE